MILVVGIPTEEPVAMAIAAAEEEAIDQVVVNQRDAADFRFDVALHNGLWTGSVDFSGTRVDIATITGIYSRMAEPSQIPRRMGVDHATALRSQAALVLLAEWVDTASCLVANRTSAMASNGSKPYQAMLIERCGFRTPTTLITSNPSTAAAFVAANRGEVVYKSISGIRSIVRRVDSRTGLDGVRAMPTQFQVLVPGTDVRVHVVGTEVYPIEIASSAVDYRYAGRDGLDAALAECELPDEVRDKCRRLSIELDLPFCGIDLRRTPEGEYVCFEVNPSPAYSYYQHMTGQPIARGLVHYLAGEQNEDTKAA